MKWFWRLTLACVIVATAVAFLPAPMVKAASSATVTVTATPRFGVMGAPTNFALAYVSDTQVNITWVKDGGATNTMVRAKVGSYPTGVADGYEVYFGAGVNTSDTGLNLDETATPVYYRAWSEDGVGGYSAGYAEDFIEGVGMQLMAFIGLAVALTIAAYVLKKQSLAMGGAGAWLFLGIYNYQLSAAAWDLNYGLFFFSMGMLIVCVLEAMFMRQPKGEDELSNVMFYGDDEDADDLDEDVREQVRGAQGQVTQMRTMREMMGGRRGRHRKAKGRPFSDKALRKFEKSGEI